jgi:glycosyltransferase involved in cell wall biosynthesis
MTTRSKILARHLDAKVIKVRISTNRFVRLLNYPFLAFITFLNLMHKKFDAVFVQLPPIQAALPAYLYCKIFKKKIIFDSHSGIFFYPGLHQKLYFRHYCSVVKHINLNLVHNQAILDRLCLKNTPSVLLEDKIYLTPSPINASLLVKIAVICGYGKDEPIQEIIESARNLPDVQFFLTGKSKKINIIHKPNNINFTGYLADSDYGKLLQSVNIIMALSNREDTVLCGAYEAVGLTKPLITSDTLVLKTYFNKGTIHTANNAQAIVQAIKTAQANLERLYNEMLVLRKEKIETWQKQFEPVEALLKKS